MRRGNEEKKKKEEKIDGEKHLDNNNIRGNDSRWQNLVAQSSVAPWVDRNHMIDRSLERITLKGRTFANCIKATIQREFCRPNSTQQALIAPLRQT